MEHAQYVNAHGTSVMVRARVEYNDKHVAPMKYNAKHVAPMKYNAKHVAPMNEY